VERGKKASFCRKVGATNLMATFEAHQNQLLVVTLSVLMIAACSVDPRPFIGPDGNNAYSMRCSGMGLDWSDCYAEAGKLCPNGYKIIQQHSGMIAVPAGSTLIAAPKQDLVVECK
jgi:hypothetical protein